MYVVSSFLDIFGLGLVASYISFFLDENSKSQYLIINSIINKIDVFEPVVTAGFLILIIFLLKFFFFLLINFLIVKFSTSQVLKMRTMLIAKYQYLYYLDFLKEDKSEYIFNANTLASSFSKLLISFLKFVGEFIIALVIIMYLFYQNFYVTLTVILILFLLYFIYDRVFKKKLNIYGESLNKSASLIYKFISEALIGLKEIRVLGKEKHFYSKIKESSKKWNNAYEKTFLISVMPKYFFEYIFIIFTVLFTLIIFFMDKDLNSYLPLIAIFIIAGIRLFPISNSILQSILELRLGRNTIIRLDNVISQMPETKWKNSDLDKKLNHENIKFEKISLKNISFKYPNSKNLIFDKVNLEIKSGSIIGITGKSGIGKSTLIDLFLGIIEPSDGNVEINGNNLKDKLYLIKDYCSYIPQQLFIIDGDICENVALGVSKNQINKSKVLDSLKKANLSNFIESLPNGIETNIGENGIKISGGQRQRLGLARSFYFEKPVLIFDEATSALDQQNENEIMQNIGDLKGKKTIVIISHKKELLNFCNEIYEIDDQQILRKK